MKHKARGLIFDIKHYAIHDGPGIRTTVFLKGCPLRCLWCANPESQEAIPEIMFDVSLCSKCKACKDACPNDAVSFKDGVRIYDREACKGCGICTSACAFEALELCGRGIDVHTLWEEIREDRAFWDRSGGGITLSGGEPLLQMEFAGEFLEFCSCRRVHTAVEICGHAPEEEFSRILELADLVLFDFKLAGSAEHKANTGVPNERILRNLKRLMASTTDRLVRMPLVPGINDIPGELAKAGKILNQAAPGARIELLPYHRLGEKKYEKLGRQYLLRDLAPPTRDQVEKAGEILAGFGLCPLLPEM